MKNTTANRKTGRRTGLLGFRNEDVRNAIPGGIIYDCDVTGVHYVGSAVVRWIIRGEGVVLGEPCYLALVGDELLWMPKDGIQIIESEEW